MFGDTGVVATLKTAANVPVTDRTVLFRVTPATGTPVVIARQTGPGGTARLGAATLADGTPLAAGSYTVQAFFGPNAALDVPIPDDPIYNPSSATADVGFTIGRGIVFASARTENGDIYVASPAGGVPVRLTSGPAIDAEPEWSPDGQTGSSSPAPGRATSRSSS